MHYRNGREAKNGDKVIQVGDKGVINAAGTLINAVPGEDYCNGNIVCWTYGSNITTVTGACLVDCLHADDVAAILAEKGLDKRPPGK